MNVQWKKGSSVGDINDMRWNFGTEVVLIAVEAVWGRVVPGIVLTVGTKGYKISLMGNNRSSGDLEVVRWT
jgi:hypothetical protein